MSQADNQRLQDEKELAHYSAVVNAWVTTRMERDKHLMAYAAGGIGLLLVLVTATAPLSQLEFIAFLIALGAFLTTVLVGIRVFDRNAEHLEKLAHERLEGDPRLDSLDTVLARSFAVGVIAASTLGIAAGWPHYPSPAISTSHAPAALELPADQTEAERPTGSVSATTPSPNTSEEESPESTETEQKP